MTEKLKAVADKFLARVNSVMGRGEEATKQALVLPMLDALGWDIWDPSEVCPEFEADFATKKAGQKEKVDLAVFLDGQPRIYIEVKSIDTALDGHEGQLKRYYNATPSVSLGILTNGIEYRLFTDTGDQNIMDEDPFFVCRIDSVDQGLDVLSKFSKRELAACSIRDFATDLKYTAKITKFLKTELDAGKDPSEEFVRWILKSDQMYSGVVNKCVVDRFRPIIRASIQKVFMDVVRRSVAAIDNQINTPQQTLPTESIPTQSSADGDSEKQPPTTARIVTSDRELSVFACFQKIFEASSFEKVIFDGTLKKDVLAELKYKDTTAYFSIYLNKTSYWVARYFDSPKQPSVAFNIDEAVGAPLVPDGFERMPKSAHGDFRVKISCPEDILRLDAVVMASFQKTIKDSRA